ncbi:C-C motif chemokine 20a.3 [Eucyclogobius newberryi]|uniref:C-C motif chemokine 20a.3 n=1 Tax=Eucyclogobius newberryi TaxID=166745 RepID=UPI003B5CF075
MVSAKAQVSLLLLSALFLMILNTSEAHISCCRRYSTIKLPFSVIRGLSIQTDRELCNINAIIFHTKRGKACFDPASNWVMEYVNRLRNKAHMVHMRTTHS